MENPYLYRTFNPKLSTYLSQGSGRDNYISHDGGGFLRRMPSLVYESSRFGDSPRFMLPSPRLTQYIYHYQSDGSGRDSYIWQFLLSRDSGGSHSPYTPGAFKQRFQQNLRENGKIRYFPQNDWLTRSNSRFIVKKRRNMIMKKKHQVQDVTERLYSSNGSRPCDKYMASTLTGSKSERLIRPVTQQCSRTRKIRN